MMGHMATVVEEVGMEASQLLLVASCTLPSQTGGGDIQGVREAEVRRGMTRAAVIAAVAKRIKGDAVVIRGRVNRRAKIGQSTGQEIPTTVMTQQ